MGRLNKCCVHGCKDMVSKRHRFPMKNYSLFKMWIDIIKPINWQSLSDKQIYNRYYVCDVHFEDRYMLKGSLRGLTVHAIPTLGVESVSAVSDDLINQTSTSKVQNVMGSTTEGSVSAVSDDSINQLSISKIESIIESTNEGSVSAVSDDSINQLLISKVESVMESTNEGSVSAVSDDSINQLLISKVESVMESTNEGSVSAVSDDSINTLLISKVESVMESSNVGSASLVSDDSSNQLLISKVESVMESTNEGSVSAFSDDSINQPSTDKVDSVMESTHKGSASAVSDDIINQPSTSKVQSVMRLTNKGIDNRSHNNVMQEPVGKLKKMKRKKVPSDKGFAILRELKYTRKTQLNPKEKILYDMLRKCRDQLNQKKHQLKAFQERLDAAQKIMHADEFRNTLSLVDEATFHFIKCHITFQKLHPKSRTLTLDEKVLSLALYKASTKAFRLLWKLFCLHSSRTYY